MEICDTERCGWLKEQSLNHEACGFLCLFLLECLPAELRKLGLMVRNVSEVKSMKSQGPGAIVPIEIHWVYIILYTGSDEDGLGGEACLNELISGFEISHFFRFLHISLQRFCSVQVVVRCSVVMIFASRTKIFCHCLL